jgi:hypothetical protein
MKSDVIDDQDQTKLLTKFYWSRVPGKFVNKRTGQAVNLGSSLSIAPPFTGTVREWYETLLETIIDVYNNMHEPTNNVYVGPNVATILESSVMFKIAMSAQPHPTTGIVKLWSIVGKDVYLDPSLTNIIKIGHHNGGSWHEGEIEVLDMNIV